MQAASGKTLTRLIELSGLRRDEISVNTGYDVSTIYRWERGEGRPRKAVLEYLRSRVNVSPPAASTRFTFIDLFAGIGGMRLGISQAGGRCIYSCECDAYARRTYSENFKDDPDQHPFPFDITTVEPGSVPDHDLLVAGFPCQPFSIAGVSKKNALGRPHGFSDLEQGNLFFTLADIIKNKRPKAFLLENVRNLVTHDGRKTFKTIIEVLEGLLQYKVQWRIIDAAGWVPQHRERVFIVGFRDSTLFDFEALSLPSPEQGPTLKSILHPEDGTEAPEPPFTDGSNAAVNPKYVLTQHLWDYLRAYKTKHEAKGNGFGYGLVGPDERARTLSARYFKDGSEILIKRLPRQRPRRLTPRECSRLMGFDMPGRQFTIPVSDTRAYKQFGNAVVVPVVRDIGRALAPHIASRAKQFQFQFQI